MISSISKQLPKVAFVASYPPRQCGIATYTSDLLRSVKSLYCQKGYLESPDYLQVIALNNTEEDYPSYSQEVSFTINTQISGEYRRAAEFLNHSPVDVVSLQHEFGLFNGENGENVLHLLDTLNKPVVTTLHTVLVEPTKGQLNTLKKICDQSSRVVVLAEKAMTLLQDVYQIPQEKIVMLHHGTPDLPFLDPAYFKEQFQAEGKKILLTFGLLGPNKGIEYVLEALPEVVRQFPDLVYFVLGATHPEILRRYGEEYRNSLEEIVKKHNLQKNVIFYNQYVTIERLLQFLKATDIYINPYVNKEQIVSGTLAYALACGKTVISTPYWYAEELLADNRGCLVPFRDSSAITLALNKLLSNETERNKMRKSAYQFGRRMIWNEVAKIYVSTFQQALLNYQHTDTRHTNIENDDNNLTIPKINLYHLRTLTDDTGLFQHATFSVPNRTHGYCTDDNARALIVTVMNWNLFKNDAIIALLDVYLSFLNYALNEENQQIRNFMSYSREWLEEQGSQDCHGRAIWALGYTIAYPPNETILCLASHLFKKVISKVSFLIAPRAWAFTIIGCLYYLKQFNGDTEVQAIVENLSHKLLKLFQNNVSNEWLWCEDLVTYDNARLPQALIGAGHYLSDKKMVSTGLRVLQWLIDVQTDQDEGHLSIIGNNGWYRRDGQKARFDQQPLEVAALIDACYQAYLTSKQPCWQKYMHWAFNWFLGKNIIHHQVYNTKTGGGYDGIRPGTINQNQGGESTISYLLALHRMHQLTNNHHLVKNHWQSSVS